MELPRNTDLTTAEKNARVEINPEDPSAYPQFYFWPFEKILKSTSSFPVPPTREWEEELGWKNWDARYAGFQDWSIPISHDNPMEGLMRVMETKWIYNTAHHDDDDSGPQYPEIQIKKLFGAPIIRSLAQRSKTLEHTEMQQKVFVMKYSLSPFNTCASEDWEERCDDKNIRVWRLIACFGETNLDTLHDRILGPSMGWIRHYHSYKFIVPTSGACFGPESSDAIDRMHAMTSYTLDASKYQLAHVLREPGQRLVYIYDLGDNWVHNIELVQVGDKGDVLNLPSDVQVRTALGQQYGTSLPELTGVQLLAGELNCPPEDSNGCNGMGRYGSLLVKGKKHHSVEAAGSMNWQEHNIKNAYDFDFVAHAKRLSDAIGGKSSAKSGHKACNFLLSPPTDRDLHLLNRAGPGEKVSHRCRGDLETGCIPVTETMKTRPDKMAEAVCAVCGRQPTTSNSENGLLRCSSCKSIRYCGKACQKSDWKRHKDLCKKLKEERSAYKKEVMESDG